MKVLLQVNSVVNTGSTGRIVEEIGQLAIENGWESYIAYGRSSRNSKSKLIKIGSKFDIILHGILTRIFDLHGFGSNGATRILINKIELINPDVIHLHNIHGYYINIRLLFNFLQKFKGQVFWTLHDCWIFTGHCVFFESIGCEKWKKECYSCPQTKEYPASFLLDNSRSNFKKKKSLFSSLSNITLIPVSNWLSNLIDQSFMNQYSKHVIHNGIDIKLFTPQKETTIRERFALSDLFVVLGVANIWEPRKGLLDFYELSKRIDKNTIIVLVGLNKNQISRLPSNIIGIQRTENIFDLVELYSAADLFVNPTWEDNYPTTNLEAMACGTPVLTYNTGGSVESVSAKTGFIVDKGDIDGVLKAIKFVKEKGKLFFTENCRLKAEKEFDKFQRYKEYISLYNSHINK